MKALCLALLATLGGCATLAASEHAQLLASAAADDQACLQQGWKYPEPRYVSCRLQLQDDRLHQDWLNLQLMHQTQAQQPNNIPAPYDPREVYRPLDPDHFDCRLLTEEKRDYILCDESQDATKP